MTMSDIGYEVLEARWRKRGIEIKIEDTPKCLEFLKREVYGLGIWVQLDQELRLIQIQYGDASGEPNGMVTAENESEVRVLTQDMSSQEEHDWYERRRAWVRKTFPSSRR